ncbi:calcium-activated chloride channel regulator 2-like [Mercenaria mercenaria]|uniref:calcium-activated chloride channel regulator 2-like n=1 Tax=Mercenaria mercenaria TaxID=6596 RepID=UPI00234E409B|nr:calcium-activated chloride channel regulator 2-like [Mercenaria mercenaria]
MQFRFTWDVNTAFVCEVMLKLYVFVVFLIWMGSWDAYGISISDGRYEDVNVIIKDSNAENQQLLEAIKKSFTNASAHLFTATRNLLYFGKIKIIVPKSWSKKSWYKQMPVRLFQMSHIIIDKDGGSANAQVRGLTECGKGASYMLLPPAFFLSRDKNRNYGRDITKGL